MAYTLSRLLLLLLLMMMMMGIVLTDNCSSGSNRIPCAFFDKKLSTVLEKTHTDS